MIRAVVMAVAALAVLTLGASTPGPRSTLYGAGRAPERAIAWHESYAARGWQPSPPVWGHGGCWQLIGPTTHYRCPDGYADTS